MLRGVLLIVSFCVVAKPSGAFDYGLIEETCQEFNLSVSNDLGSLLLENEDFLELMRTNNEFLSHFAEALQTDNPFNAQLDGEKIFNYPEVKQFDISSSLSSALELRRNARLSAQASFNDLSAYIKSTMQFFAEESELNNNNDPTIAKQLDDELQKMFLLWQAANVDYFNSTINTHYLGYLQSNLISDVYKLCSYRYLPNFNNAFELNFPDDFPFVFETIHTANQRLEEQILGAKFSGSGTIQQSKGCIEPGKIFPECHILSLQDGSSLLIILIDKINLKQRYELTKAKTVDFKNCIISEVGNPRGIGGAQVTAYLGNLKDELRDAAVDSVSNAKDSSNTIQEGLTKTLLGFTERILKPETKYEVLNTVTCELSFADLILK